VFYIQHTRKYQPEYDI